MVKIVDSHTHVQFPQFNKDRDEVIQRALDAGIWMINVGADMESSKKAVELAEKYKEGVYAAVGVHPHEAEKNLIPELVEGLRNLAKNPKVVAIGECGLDYYNRQPTPSSRAKLATGQATDNQQQKNKQEQKELFLEHIRLAKEVDKPLMIHCRDAFEDLIKILSTFPFLLSSSNVIHFFTGTLNDAKQLLELGFYFTFGGLITYNRQFDEVIKFIPLDRILAETDAPYVTPEPYRGHRNEPLYVFEVAKKIAEIKNIPFEEFCERVVENNRKVFKI